MSPTATPTASYRPLHFGVTRGVLTPGANGVNYLKAEQPFEPCAARMTDRLVHWATMAPNRTWAAQRVKNADGSRGDWRFPSHRNRRPRRRTCSWR